MDEVRKVKRRQGLVIEDPYVIGPKATIGQARSMPSNLHVSGLLASGPQGELLGIITRKDIRFTRDEEKVSGRMTLREKLIIGRRSVGFNEAWGIMEQHSLEKLSLVNEQGLIAGWIAAKHLERHRGIMTATRERKGRLQVAATVGVTGDYCAHLRRHLPRPAQMPSCWILRMAILM